jgi:CubicO group peptidase (beta-lactamase class C family)
MSLAVVETALEKAAERAAVPGFVAMARWRDGNEYLCAFGRRSIAGVEAMTPDTVFWIASMTKLVTSVAALQLIAEGKLSLETPVAEILPKFAELPILDGFDAAGAPRLRKAADAPTVRHLLTHTSGLGYTFLDADLHRYAEQTGIDIETSDRLPRRFEAGARWQYGTNTDWLGQVIAAVAGEGLDKLFARRIFKPLGMADTSFAPTPEQAARQAQVHARLPDGGLAPIEFGMPAPPHFMMGGAGLYSTASDYMKLLTGLLGDAVLPASARPWLFDNAVGDLQCGFMPSVDHAMANDYEPMPGLPKRWSLGLLINLEPGPDGRSAGSGAWAGLANCYYWLDPARGVAAVLLSQILPFADPEMLGLVSTFERTVYV